MPSPNYVFMDGFDKYGPAGMSNSLSMLVDNEWTSATFTGNMSMVAGLGSAGGQAIQTSASVVYKDLGASYARCIGGGWFAHSASSTSYMVNLSDGSTSQCTVAITSGGVLTAYRGRGSTVLATGPTFPSADTNCIEWDIVVHNTTGYIKVYVNGTLVINYSGDTASTANNSYSRVGWEAGSSSGSLWIDHYYTWHYSAAGGGDTPALDQPVIETDWPDADQAVAWDVLRADMSNLVDLGGSRFNSTATRTSMRRVTAPASGNITELQVFINRTTSLSCQVGVYAHDPAASGGTGGPGARLGVSAASVGTTAGTYKLIALTAPVAVTQGTIYWLAFSMDGNSGSTDCIENSGESSSTYGRYVAGIMPSPAPGGTTTTEIPLLIATMTGVTTRYTEVNRSRPDGVNYVGGDTVGEQDLYSMGPLDITPAAIHMVGLKVNAFKSDAGARQLDLQMNVGGTDYTGNQGAAIAPGLSAGWYSTYFNQNPATAAAWTKADLDAAYAGYEIVL